MWVLGFVLSGPPAVATGTFLQWLDDFEHTEEPGLLQDATTVIRFLSSPAPVVVFSGHSGEAYIFGRSAREGASRLGLMYVNSITGKSRWVPLDIPADSELSCRVETDREGNAVFYSSVPERLAPPTQRKRIRWDREAEATVEDLPADAAAEIFQPATMDCPGTLATAFKSGPCVPRRITWGEQRTEVLPACFEPGYEPDLYLFSGDNFLGIRRQALMPLNDIYFLRNKNGGGFMVKCWFKVTVPLASDTSPSPVGTAQWTLQADRLDCAVLFSGRQLLLRAVSADEDVFYFFDLRAVLDRKARLISGNGSSANW